MTSVAGGEPVSLRGGQIAHLWEGMVQGFPGYFMLGLDRTRTGSRRLHRRDGDQSLAVVGAARLSGG